MSAHWNRECWTTKGSRAAVSARIGTLEEQLEHPRLPAQARLACPLYSLARRLGTEVALEVYEVVLELRHDEIVSLAGTGRSSVTQALSAWRSMGVVSGTRDLYQIDVRKLEALSDLLEAEVLD